MRLKLGGYSSEAEHLLAKQKAVGSTLTTRSNS